MIQERILELVKYGLVPDLLTADEVYTIKQLLELFQVDEIEDAVFEKVENLHGHRKRQKENLREYSQK